MYREYRNAMTKIEPSDGYETALLERLNAESAKTASTAKNARMMYITAACFASAAVFLVMVYSVLTFIIPMLDQPLSKITDTDNENIVLKSDDSQPTSISSDEWVPFVIEDEDGETEYPRSISDEEGYSIVTYSGNDNSPKIKHLKSTDSYDVTLHFIFTGFDKYGIALKSNDFVLDAVLPSDYTATELLRDYYDEITSGGDIGLINNGMIDRFFGVYAKNDRPICVYIEGVEILDLDNTRLSYYKDMGDVYFEITVA